MLEDLPRIAATRADGHCSCSILMICEENLVVSEGNELCVTDGAHTSAQNHLGRHVAQREDRALQVLI